MRFLGETQFPEFPESEQGNNPNPYFLGHACQGEQVPHCLEFYQGFFKDFDKVTLGKSVCVQKCRRK